MKKCLLYYLLLLVSNSLLAQKALPKATIKDFAAVCWFNYRHGNTVFIATMNTYLPYDRIQVAILMENLDTDHKGREEVFKLFYRFAGNYESLFNNFYSLKLTAQESKELAFYVLDKYSKPKEEKEEVRPTVLKTETGEVVKTYSDDEVSYNYVSNVLPDKGEKFFQGTKNYEGHIDDVFVVTIIGTKIKIIEPMNGDKALVDGIIRDGRIWDKAGKETKFRYKKGMLYYNGEMGKWYLFWQLEE